MKVQRQIAESRRIARDYDNERNLQIEVSSLQIDFKKRSLNFNEAIILAGGLSQNPYLKSKMRGYFESHPLSQQKPVSIQIRPS